MRKVWFVLVVCGLQLTGAEKNRDWKAGQVVEADQTNASLHTIASTDRNYLVRGVAGDSDQSLAVGASVRFAVEGKTMFISLDGKEYHLYVLGERVAASKDSGAQNSGPPPPISPPSSVPAARPAPGAPAKPLAAAGESQGNALSNVLDNDAVVKMIVGGLKEDTVVRVIETRAGKYTLNNDALAALRTAGVPQSVIAAMSAKMASKQ